MRLNEALEKPFAILELHEAQQQRKDEIQKQVFLKQI